MVRLLSVHLESQWAGLVMDLAEGVRSARGRSRSFALAVCALETLLMLGLTLTQVASFFSLFVFLSFFSEGSLFGGEFKGKPKGNPPFWGSPYVAI